MDENITKIVGTCGMDEYIGNHTIRNYWKKESHDLLVENSVNYYYPRKYGGFNGEWVNMDEFFDQVKFAAELCSMYKHVLFPLVTMEIKIKLELHVSYIATGVAYKTYKTHIH